MKSRKHAKSLDWKTGLCDDCNLFFILDVDIRFGKVERVSNSRGLFFPVEDVANNRAGKSEECSSSNCFSMFVTNRLCREIKENCHWV